MTYCQLRAFWVHFWNRWIEFEKTWQEAIPHRLYKVCVFRADKKTNFKVAAQATD